MAYSKHQFEDFIRRSLQRRQGLHSEAAVMLLLGTAAQESAFGTYLYQMGGGPARGAFQMEKPTYDWLHSKFIPKYPELARYAFPMVEWDLDHATVMCRLLYKAYPDPLPAAEDIPAMAALWKKRYNTPSGKGTPEEFLKNWNRYVA